MRHYHSERVESRQAKRNVRRNSERSLLKEVCVHLRACVHLRVRLRALGGTERPVRREQRGTATSICALASMMSHRQWRPIAVCSHDTYTPRVLKSHVSYAETSSERWQYSGDVKCGDDGGAANAPFPRHGSSYR